LSSKTYSAAIGASLRKRSAEENRAIEAAVDETNVSSARRDFTFYVTHYAHK
jgi:hypothetical protein